MGTKERIFFLFAFFSFSVSIGLSWPAKTKVLHIGGIFPINGTEGWQGGQACQPAARLALEDVNNRTDLIPGYQLKLHWNDSECEPGLGALVMYDLLYKPPQKLMLLAGCSTVSTTVAEAARMWNLIVLSYGASSPALSNRQRFPTLFRTHPSATVHNPTRVKLMQHFGWSRIAILQQAEEVFTSTVEDLESRCRDASIEIITRQSFLNDPTEAVRNLRRQDARIIVGLFYVVAARRVLCEMYKQGLYGRLYVWFFIGWYEDNWYEVNLAQEKIECTREQMKLAAEGHITTEALNWNQDNSTTISGMTVEDFRLRLNAALKQQGYDIDNDRYPEGYQEAPLAYDAIWAAAMALNKTMERLNRRKNVKIEDFTYSNKEIAAELYSAMNSTQFLGVSGTVAFSSKGDRIAWTQFEQMLGGKYYKLGYYDTQTDNLTWLMREKWIGRKVPQDRTIIREVLRTVSHGLFTTMCVVSVIGILIAIGLFVFNTMYRDRRLIQMSQPSCNNLMLLGIILLLSSVFVLGLDGETVPVGHFEFVCQARAWLLCCGFTLAFGAMFSKVWHVHRLSTKAKQEGKVEKHGKVDWLVCGLLLVDVVVLGVWAIIDPLYRNVEQFALEDPTDSNEDMKNKPILEHCVSQSQNIWLGVVYGYKGLLLMFGLFLAYETRSLKVKSINDTRFVGMSIYNVVVLCLITAPVTLVISSQQDASFAFVTLALVFCCFLSMALVFVPKIIEVVRHPSDKTEAKPSERLASREEEEKLRKLMAENEQLQKLIAAKEEKVRLLTAKVQEKSTAQKKVSVTKNSEVRFQLSPHDSPKEKHGEVIEKEALSTTTNTSATLVIGEDIYMENIPAVEKPEGKYALEESYL